jgi:hypothetical protein
VREAFGRLSLGTRAGFLSFLIPGLGHVWLGLLGRAAIWFVGLLVVGGIAGAEAAQAWVAPVAGGLLALFSAADAALVAPGSPRAGRR